VRFPDAGRAEPQEVFLIIDPSTVKEIDDFRFSYPFDPAKVKMVDFLDHRKMSAHHVPLDPALDSIRYFRGKNCIQECNVGLFPDLCVIYHLIKAVDYAP